MAFAPVSFLKKDSVKKKYVETPVFIHYLLLTLRSIVHVCTSLAETICRINITFITIAK